MIALKKALIIMKSALLVLNKLDLALLRSKQMKTKILSLIIIVLSLAIVSASGFLVYQKTGFNVLAYANQASASVVKTVSGVFRAEEKMDEKNQEKNTGKNNFKMKIKNNTNATASNYNDSEIKKESQNLTDSLTQTMAEQMIKNGLDPSLLDQNSESINQALESSLNNTENLFIVPKITDEEIKISKNNSKKAIQEYAQELQSTLNKIFTSSTFQKSDLEVAIQAIETNNYTELDEYISAYQIAYDQIKDITAPSTWKEIHKEQLAIFSVSKELLSAFRDNQNDPMKSMIALVKYPEIEEQAFNLAQKMAKMKK
tara:strand:+ start:352 stop:1296 length:945 start_codon:yes stop_codon:yes gene_type:complete